MKFEIQYGNTGRVKDFFWVFAVVLEQSQKPREKDALDWKVFSCQSKFRKTFAHKAILLRPDLIRNKVALEKRLVKVEKLGKGKGNFLMWNRTKPFSKFYFYFVLPTMPDRCDQTNVIYQADVHAENKIMSYYGSTEMRTNLRKDTVLTSHPSRKKKPNATLRYPHTFGN